MSREGTDDPPRAAAHVRPLQATVTEIAAVEVIARASFEEGSVKLQDELARPWSRIWVARLDRDEPVGFLVAWHVADELHVLTVATAEPFRRRGVGLALMNESIRYAREHAIRILLLEVRRSNRSAIKLYRKLGFTALGMRPGYYADNGEDAIEMILGFDPTTGAILPGRDEIRIDV